MTAQEQQIKYLKDAIQAELTLFQQGYSTLEDLQQATVKLNTEIAKIEGRETPEKIKKPANT